MEISSACSWGQVFFPPNVWPVNSKCTKLRPALLDAFQALERFSEAILMLLVSFSSICSLYPCKSSYLFVCINIYAKWFPVKQESAHRESLEAMAFNSIIPCSRQSRHEIVVCICDGISCIFLPSSVPICFGLSSALWSLRPPILSFPGFWLQLWTWSRRTFSSSCLMFLAIHVMPACSRHAGTRGGSQNPTVQFEPTHHPSTTTLWLPNPCVDAMDRGGLQLSIAVTTSFETHGAANCLEGWRWWRDV